MSEIAGKWISVGSRLFQRNELYGSSWRHGLDDDSHPTASVVAAPFGGPVLHLLGDGYVRVHTSSGIEISKWKWKNARIVTCDWSNVETAVFVVDDGSVFVYDIFGEIKSVFSMGQEAKDLKIADARVFRGQFTSGGVAVLTTAKRFFVVNNIADPRVRKMVDVDLGEPGVALAWDVLTSERHVRILVGRGAELTSITNTDHISVNVDVPAEKAPLQWVHVSFNSEFIAVLYADGLLWVGTFERKFCMVRLRTMPSSLAWCGNSAVICFYTTKAAFDIVSIDGHVEEIFFPDYVGVVQEMDGVRVFSKWSQDFVEEVHQVLVDTFSIGSLSPGAVLRMAAEEFANKSHKADDYIRMISERLDIAVNACITCAGLLHDPLQQKELLRAAHFGKSFVTGISGASVDAFTSTCVRLRVLNAIRNYRIGIPLTLRQFEFLTVEVIIDRLLARRLYPLALQICKFLKLPASQGESRVLAHWACYKVSTIDKDDASVAKAVRQRLGHHPQISYCEIAAKAAECGKKDLAIQLLEHEIRVDKQVPLLVQLGQESAALQKALSSGDKDLAYSVLLRLRVIHTPSDFHVLVRRYPLAKVLYQNYCLQYDSELLDDWFAQEDEFQEMAEQSFKRAYSANRADQRAQHLVTTQENFHKARNEAFQALAEENNKLLRVQINLEDKLGQSFVGMTLNQTLVQLLKMDQSKQAERIKQDFKVADKRFMLLRVNSLIEVKNWQELVKLLKQQKKASSVSALNVVRTVRERCGDHDAKMLLADDQLLSGKERAELFAEMNMFVEAASVAFKAKDLETLSNLESMCAGKEDLLRTISSYRTKLATQ